MFAILPGWFVAFPGVALLVAGLEGGRGQDACAAAVTPATAERLQQRQWTAWKIYAVVFVALVVWRAWVRARRLRREYGRA